MKRKAKIDDFRFEVDLVNQYIFGFDVSMDNILSVNVGQTKKDTLKNFNESLERDCVSFFEEVLKISSHN